MEFVIPEGFLEGQVAVRCGSRAMDFWNYVVENFPQCRSRRVDFEWQLYGWSKYGENVTVAMYRNAGALGWDQADWYRSERLTVVDIEECIERAIAPIEQPVLANILCGDGG